MSSVKETKIKKTPKISSWNIFGTSKKNQKEKPTILPNPPKFNKSAHGSIDSRDPEADQDFQGILKNLLCFIFGAGFFERGDNW